MCFFRRMTQQKYILSFSNLIDILHKWNHFKPSLTWNTSVGLLAKRWKLNIILDIMIPLWLHYPVKMIVIMILSNFLKLTENYTKTKLTIMRISKMAIEWAVIVNTTKTLCMLFTQKKMEMVNIHSIVLSNPRGNFI